MTRSPFHVPRRAAYSTLGISLVTFAAIHTMTTERVKGSIGDKPFDVKHDGHTFSVGGGSSKMRFYFDDWKKVPKKA